MLNKEGAGKKKFLTDPVEIIPFPDQQLREKANKSTPKQQKPAVKSTPSSVDYVQKPAPKVMEAPSGKLKTSSISIKKMMEKKTASESGEIDLSNMPRENYDMDDLKRAWRKFAFTAKEQGKSTLYNALMRREPTVVGEHEYHMEVDNASQVDHIRPDMTDLLESLRSELKNYDILVELKITENPDEEVKYKSGKEKFAALARKNPNLHILKNTFNLDIEF